MSWTIAELIAERMTLTGYCHNPRCHHNQRLDLDQLQAKLGPDAPAMAADLAPKLKCARCGGQDVGLIYSPSTNADRTKPAEEKRPPRTGRPGGRR